MKGFYSLILFGSVFSSALYANPSGATVVAGEATIEPTSSNSLQITTGTTAIINWKNFSIEEGELTQFIQPGPTSAVLNRVVSGDPSTLAGILKGNGQVYLVNPNGIFVTEHAVIDTNCFIAQTFDFADEQFLAHDFSNGPLFTTPILSDNSLETAIRHSGRISATTLTSKGGQIYLIADRGTVEVDGRLEAPGGEIRVIGEYISLSDRAQIDTSSPTSGGKILVGGDFHGANSAIPNARQVSAGPSASIQANSTEMGDGGNVVIWSEDGTQFHGRIEAKGGELGGNGGEIEVSGRQYLDYQGLADASATLGKTGTLLLDPFNITLAAANMNVTLPGAPPFIHMPTGAGSTISTATVDANLATAAVIIESSGSALGLEPGNVIISTAFLYTRANNLTFRTNNLSTLPPVTIGDILIQANVRNGGTGSITFDSVQDIFQTGGASTRTTTGNLTYLALRDINLGSTTTGPLTQIRTTSTGLITLNAGRDLVVQGGVLPSGDVQITTDNGAIQISAGQDCNFYPSTDGSIEMTATTGLNVTAGRDLTSNLMNNTTFVQFFTEQGPLQIIVPGTCYFGDQTLVLHDNIDNMPITFAVGGDLTMNTGVEVWHLASDGDVSIVVGGDMTMNSDGLFATKIEVEMGAETIQVGGSFTLNNAATIIRKSGPKPVQITVGGDLSLNGGTVFDIYMDGTFQASAGNDINLSSSGFQNTMAGENGNIEFTAGNNFNMSGTAFCTTLGAGSVFVSAGNSIGINDTSTISTTTGSMTLLADNDFPNPPLIGTGQFIKSAGATIATSGGALLIYTARQNLNSIGGSLNGTPFVPGPEFVNTDLEMWGVYYPHNSGFPYTIFYKNILVSPSVITAFNIAAYEFLQGLEIDLFDRFFYSVESFDLIKAVGRDENWKLDPIGRYFYLRKQVLPFNMYWFDHSYSKRME
jgi:filamentous hemagglutinin family protein